MSFAKFFRSAFLQNTFGRLLLNGIIPELPVFTKCSAKAYAEPCLIFKMKRSAKIVNGFYSLSIFVNAPFKMFDRVLNMPLCCSEKARKVDEIVITIIEVACKVYLHILSSRYLQ